MSQHNTTPHHTTPHMKSRRFRFVSHLITSAKETKHTQYSRISQDRRGENRTGEERRGEERTDRQTIAGYNKFKWGGGFYYLLHKERKSYHLFPVLLISTYVRYLITFLLLGLNANFQVYVN